MMIFLNDLNHLSLRLVDQASGIDSNQQRAVVVGEVTSKDFSENADLCVGADDKTADAPQQTHHHGNQRDQSELPDQPFKFALQAARSVHARLVHGGAWSGFVWV